MRRKITSIVAVLGLSSMCACLLAGDAKESPVKKLIEQVLADNAKERQTAEDVYQKFIKPAQVRRDEAFERANKKAVERLNKIALDAKKMNEELVAAMAKEAAGKVSTIPGKPVTIEEKTLVENLQAIAPVIGNSRFMAISAPVSWTDAKTICTRMGGRLACLDTPDKFYGITKFTQERQFWIGATRNNQKWTWISGKDVDEKLWTKDSPRKGQDFALTYTKNTMQTWKDEKIHTIVGFICEWR